MCQKAAETMKEEDTVVAGHSLEVLLFFTGRPHRQSIALLGVLLALANEPTHA